jgi:hypothetical protein
LKKKNVNQAKANLTRLETTDSLEKKVQAEQEQFLKKCGKCKEIQEQEREAVERKQREMVP